ncbi:S-layer homology domain-containing protein [Bacillus sp. FJAT-28004]|uniref:S-layer homology domain-containing protein n=1 Tax=Bacillus sp. FJAT-28004 TaxID=1679165 RepID=UPI000B119F26
MSGYPDDSFRPDMPLTRMQFAIMLGLDRFMPGDTATRAEAVTLLLRMLKCWELNRS